MLFLFLLVLSIIYKQRQKKSIHPELAKDTKSQIICRNSKGGEYDHICSFNTSGILYPLATIFPALTCLKLYEYKEYMQSNSPDVLFSVIVTIIYVVVIVLSLVGFWKLFKKAGRPGWHCLIPVFSTYQLIKISNKPGWWLILMFIPIVQILFSLLIYIELAKAFGRSTAFGALLLWLFPIGFLIIGFGKSKYIYGAPSSTLVQAQTPTPPPTPTAPTQQC